MKKVLFSLALLACLILCVFFFASCNRNEATPSTAPSTAPETADRGTEDPETVPTGTAEEGEPVTEIATTDKWEEISAKLARIAARDRQLKIECSVAKSAEKGSKNDIYVAGPDTIEDGVTPPIEEMIYNRNRAACDLLGTTVTYLFWDYGFGKQAEQIDLVIKGNAADAPDLFVSMLNDVFKELRNSTFKDVKSIPGSYFDFSAKGWLYDWMMTLSFTGDRAYILGSDYFLDIMRSLAVLPFNMTMMNANSEKLAPAIIGEDDDPLGAGEELSTRFFDLVDEGKWTWDVLGKLCEAIWVDENGDGQDSITDTLGIIADQYGGLHASSYIYSCGEELTEVYTIEDPDNPYHGKQWIKYADDPTKLNRIFDAVKSVFDGAGSLVTLYQFSGNSPEQPGAAYHHTKFAASELLFAGVCTTGTLEEDVFQQMTDLYSVVPLPKIDVERSYNTLINNQGDVGVINVNANPRKAKVLSAFVQWCTEHSGPIREQFMQIVMKYKVTTYNQGTDRMLDLIYDGILYSRDYVVDGENEEPRWHRQMMSQRFVAGADFIATLYEANRAKKQQILDKLMEKWYTLPKVETNAE